MDPAAVLELLRSINPARHLRRMIWREPPPPAACRSCGKRGEMKLDSTGFVDGHVVESWRCAACGAPRTVAFPKP